MRNTVRMTLQWLFMACACLLLLACGTSSSLLHSSGDSSLPDNIGIHGYSPVSYFEHNRAERGNPDYTTTYKNRLFYFTSAEQIATFRKNPEKYLPKYGEYCPYSLALGRRVAIDPTNFKIHDGELLLFHNSVELSTVNVPAQSDIYSKADEQYHILSIDF